METWIKRFYLKSYRFVKNVIKTHIVLTSFEDFCCYEKAMKFFEPMYLCNLSYNLLKRSFLKKGNHSAFSKPLQLQQAKVEQSSMSRLIKIWTDLLLKATRLHSSSWLNSFRVSEKELGNHTIEVILWSMIIKTKCICLLRRKRFWCFQSIFKQFI